jgi:hypothetical protein
LLRFSLSISFSFSASDLHVIVTFCIDC